MDQLDLQQLSHVVPRVRTRSPLNSTDIKITILTKISLNIFFIFFIFFSTDSRVLSSQSSTQAEDRQGEQVEQNTEGPIQ